MLSQEDKQEIVGLIQEALKPIKNRAGFKMRKKGSESVKRGDRPCKLRPFTGKKVMKRFLVIDQFLVETTEVEATDHLAACLSVLGGDLGRCLGEELICLNDLTSDELGKREVSPISGSKTFVDEGSFEGWEEAVSSTDRIPSIKSAPSSLNVER